MTARGSRAVRLVLPHQLFEQHLRVEKGTLLVLVEHDLMFRQYRFHAQKLVLHRASMRRFADRLAEAGHDVEVVETDGRTTSRRALGRLLERVRPARVRWYDVVDDWLDRDLRATLADVGYEPHDDDVLESPNFLTSRAELRGFFGDTTPRMQHFYAWQRRRLDVLVDDGEPVGGRWSFDEDNRKRLPKDHVVPPVPAPDRHARVDEAIDWVARAFPDAPGKAERFAWPTDHAEARAGLETFLTERFADFGPYEDAISARHPHLFHSLLTPGLNIGLLSPRHVLDRALAVGEDDAVPLPSLEGFVRQVIGWREYMRAMYEIHGRRLRTSNRLRHARPLEEGWWTATTGLAPVDHVLEGVLRTGYAHHIERLMVLGNAMCLLRTHPDAAYEWFMEMFVDAYDWVMVPNVYAMSQFAAAEAITTKPYVSGSAYLRRMSDLPKGDWVQDWDALYWTFVRDHLDGLAGNARTRVMALGYGRLDAGRKAALARRAGGWLT